MSSLRMQNTVVLLCSVLEIVPEIVKIVVHSESIQKHIMAGELYGIVWNSME